jgi:hypothetical protein
VETSNLRAVWVIRELALEGRCNGDFYKESAI